MNEVKKEKNTWLAYVDGYEILIKNETSTLGLYIDRKLQDVYLGGIATGNIHLHAVTPSGRKIRVIAGGDFKLRCYIFVDDECIFEDK